MSQRPQQPHDRFFRATFSSLELVWEYLEQCLPGEMLGRLDLRSLQPQKDSFLDEELQKQYSDLIYRCRFADSHLRISFLFEHKSYVPVRPWLQLLRYLVLAYEAQILQGLPDDKLEVVLPIVVYHGEQRWQLRPVRSYFHLPDEPWAAFLPEFRYLLTDLSQYREEDLLAMDGQWLRHAFMALKYSRSRNIFERLETILQGLDFDQENEASATFIRWIFVYLFQTGTPKENIMDAIDKLNEPMQKQALTIWEQAVEEGLERGRLEGLQEATFEVFRNGFREGFSREALQRLTKVSPEQAQQWWTKLEAGQQ